LIRFKELHRLVDERHKKKFNIDETSNLPSSKHFNPVAISPLQKKQIRAEPKLPLTQPEISPIAQQKLINLKNAVHLSG
jgi:hypothetical protein